MVFAASVLFVIEASSWLALWILRGQAGSFPPSRARSMAELATYLERRDPVLGWPTRTRSAARDSSGSRVVPSFPDPGHECLSAYGDSFVYGSDVDDTAVWGNQLSRMLGCRVANFGVDGYGTDQSLLRFRANLADSAPVSILGVISHNLIRNVTQNAYFLWGGSYLATMKPRFVLDASDRLKLVGMPVIDSTSLDLAISDPGAIFTSDELLPGSAFGPVTRKFPFTLAALRWLARTAAQRSALVPWRDMIAPAHPSGAFEVTIEIISAFVHDCAARHKVCFVVIFPEAEALRLFEAEGEPLMQEFQRELEGRGIPVLDLVHGFMSRIGRGSYCDYFVEKGCKGHYNKAGNLLVAELLREYLEASGAFRGGDRKYSAYQTRSACDPM
jgi:hypothetical protein